MLTYHPGGFFAHSLTEAGIRCSVASGTGGLSRVRGVRAAFARSRPDVVLAFLPMPSLYAELASIGPRRWGLVVGERSSAPGAYAMSVRLRRRLHGVADGIVTNSHANRLMLEATVPALRNRVATIYNSVDFAEFAPQAMPPRESGALRIVIAASYRRVKNVCGWVEAIRLLHARCPGLDVVTRWYGGPASAARGGDERESAARLIAEYGLQTAVHLNDAEPNIARRYAEAHVVALPSFYEGLPNVVCEGMACGRPVATSAVSDAGNLVEHERTGVLFDPLKPESICDAVAFLASASRDDLDAMGQAGLERARLLFDPQTVGGAYRRILESAGARRRDSPVFWPDQVPATALATVEATCAH